MKTRCSHLLDSWDCEKFLNIDDTCDTGEHLPHGMADYCWAYDPTKESEFNREEMK